MSVRDHRRGRLSKRPTIPKKVKEPERRERRLSDRAIILNEVQEVYRAHSS